MPNNLVWADEKGEWGGTIALAGLLFGAMLLYIVGYWLFESGIILGEKIGNW